MHNEFWVTLYVIWRVSFFIYISWPFCLICLSSQGVDLLIYGIGVRNSGIVSRIICWWQRWHWHGSTEIHVAVRWFWVWCASHTSTSCLRATKWCGRLTTQHVRTKGFPDIFLTSAEQQEKDQPLERITNTENQGKYKLSLFDCKEAEYPCKSHEDGHSKCVL